MYSNLDRPTARGFYAELVEKCSNISDVILQSNRGVQFFKKTNFPRSLGLRFFQGWGGDFPWGFVIASIPNLTSQNTIVSTKNRSEEIVCFVYVW